MIMIRWQRVQASLRAVITLTVSGVTLVACATPGDPLARGVASQPKTYEDIFARLKDEVSYYELSAAYYRGELDSVLGSAQVNRAGVMMDAEHPPGMGRTLDKAYLGSSVWTRDKDCDLSYFDFDVVSYELKLSNTSDTTNSFTAKSTFSLPALTGSNVGGGIGASNEIKNLNTIDIFRNAFSKAGDPSKDNTSPMNVTFLAAHLHPAPDPTAPPVPVNYTLPSSDLDVYGDALRCSSLRYHAWLRQQANSDAKAAKPNNLQLRWLSDQATLDEGVINGSDELTKCRQSEELSRFIGASLLRAGVLYATPAQRWGCVPSSTKGCKPISDFAQLTNDSALQGAVLTLKSDDELLTDVRRTPVVPMAEFLLDTRRRMIEAARQAPVCMVPPDYDASKSSAKPTTLTVEFTITNDANANVGFTLTPVPVTLSQDVKVINDNSVIFTLQPHNLYKSAPAPAAPSPVFIVPKPRHSP